jgi:hypothetical protein
MSIFDYTRDIPDAPNNPSNDQPKMKINNNSVEDLIAVDHVTFRASPGGTHKQTTFSTKNTPGAQLDPQSVLYTASGTAVTIADMFYRNQNGIFQASPIKAWATFAGATGGIIASQSVNITSIIRASAGVYNVTITTNATNSADYAILITSTAAAAPISNLPSLTYTITGTATFTIRCVNPGNIPSDPTALSFIVIQL